MQKRMLAFDWYHTKYTRYIRIAESERQSILNKALLQSKSYTIVSFYFHMQTPKKQKKALRALQLLGKAESSNQSFFFFFFLVFCMCKLKHFKSLRVNFIVGCR
jgi:hypothetical protein